MRIPLITALICSTTTSSDPLHEMGNTSSYRAASSPAASASSATAMVESPSKTRPTSISGGSPRSDAETQSASPATAMVESPSKTQPTPISGGSSPRHSFFPRTDAEARSSPRRVIVGTPSARGLEADAEQRPPSPTGYKLKRVTVGGEEYLAETPTVLLADSPQKKRKPRQDGITRCACGNPECDELSGRLQAAGVRVSYHRLPSEPPRALAGVLLTCLADWRAKKSLSGPGIASRHRPIVP